MKLYTWRRSRPLQQARQDFFLLSSLILPAFLDLSKLPSFQSDHSIVTMSLKFTYFNHDKGVWKHNNSLLCDIDYLNTINKTINEITQTVHGARI